MDDRWFVVALSAAIDMSLEIKQVAGPFSTEAIAVAVAKEFKQPGEYIIYGPAPATRKVTIAAPVVSDEVI
jgi:hypothetical protein